MRVVLDVSKLVYRVQEQKLLLYPVLIYLIGQTLRHLTNKAYQAVYPLEFSERCYGLRQLPVEQRFTDFFEGYVQNCFEAAEGRVGVFSSPEGDKISDFFVSYLAEGMFEIEQNHLPKFYLGALENGQNISLTIKDLPLSSDYDCFLLRLKEAVSAFSADS